MLKIAQTLHKPLFKNNLHVWICQCIILFPAFITNSEAVMLSKWIFELTSSLSNEMSGFQPQFLPESLSLRMILHVLSYDYSLCYSYALCNQ